MMTDNVRRIGNIGNYYGGLAVKDEGDKFYWSIENYDGHNWYEISKDLYNALNQHEDENNKE